MPITLEQLLALIPASERDKISSMVIQFSPDLLDMSKDMAWGYLMRFMNGDLMAVQELLAKKTDEQFLREVAATTAGWEATAHGAAALKETKDKIIAALAPIAVTILLALVGL